MRPNKSQWIRGLVNVFIWVVVSVLIYVLLFDDTLVRALLIGLGGGVMYAVAFEGFRAGIRRTREG